MATLTRPVDLHTVLDEDALLTVGGSSKMQDDAARVLDKDQSERLLSDLQAETKPLTPQMQHAIERYRAVMKKP